MVGRLVDGTGALRGVLGAISQYAAAQLLLGIGAAQGALAQRLVEGHGTVVHGRHIAGYAAQAAAVARMHQRFAFLLQVARRAAQMHGGASAAAHADRATRDARYAAGTAIAARSGSSACAQRSANDVATGTAAAIAQGARTGRQGAQPAGRGARRSCHATGGSHAAQGARQTESVAVGATDSTTDDTGTDTTASSIATSCSIAVAAAARACSCSASSAAAAQTVSHAAPPSGRVQRRAVAHVLLLLRLLRGQTARLCGQTLDLEWGIERLHLY